MAGDVGGTKTTLALFDPDNLLGRPSAQETYRSGHFDNLTDIVERFCAAHPAPLVGAAFGVAGPVVEGRARITNLPWRVDGDALAQALGLPSVALLNDLEALATAIPHLAEDDTLTLQVGDPEPHGPIAVVAPGTGLGEAFLIWNGRRYVAHPSEGGHAGFAPDNELQLALWQYMHRRHEHVSFERVCSGQAIPDLFAFLREHARLPVPPALADALRAADDPAPVLAQAALEGTADIALATFRLFVDILGNETANLVLKLRALGGAYLGGGIPPRILPLLQDGTFLTAFRRTGRFSALMEQVPVHIIVRPDAPLLGAAAFGLARDR